MLLHLRQQQRLNDALGRLESISESGQTLESYSYLGMSTVVERLQDQSGIKLTYVAQGSGDHADDGGDGVYTGLDRFGRVVDQRWSIDAKRFICGRHAAPRPHLIGKHNVRAPQPRSLTSAYTPHLPPPDPDPDPILPTPPRPAPKAPE